MRDEYDFSTARRGAVDPPPPGKTRITIRLDNDVLDWFRARVEAAGGGNYQSLINAARELNGRAAARRRGLRRHSAGRRRGAADSLAGVEVSVYSHLRPEGVMNEGPRGALPGGGGPRFRLPRPGRNACAVWCMLLGENDERVRTGALSRERNPPCITPFSPSP
jgi:hypothetical protein